MSELRVLLVCGGGTSTAFLAQSMRKAAKKSGQSLQVDARSESDIGDFIGKIDVVLVGSHLDYLYESIEERLSSTGIKSAVVPPMIYGTLDGVAALALANELHES